MLPRNRVVVVAVVIVAAATAGLARAAQPQSQSLPSFARAVAPVDTGVRNWFPVRHSLCDVRREPLSYSWPVKPFRSPHPIRAFFGDPRTVFLSDTNADSGSFSFHNGIDIAVPDGTPVYPVYSGVVTVAAPDEVVVESRALGRTTQYWHLQRKVWVGRHVQAYSTVLGLVRPGRGHVHFTEIDDGVVVNPLRPGHLMPYRKRTIPTVTGVYLRDSRGGAVDPRNVSGTITLATTAYDTPPAALPAPWTGVPLTPAIVRWGLTASNGRTALPPQTAVDFSSTIPRTDGFGRVYDTGTYQNFPTAGNKYFFGAHGRYIFKLTASALDTRRLAPGAYTLTVSALDTCGNLGTFSETIDVAPQPPIRPIVASFSAPLPTTPLPHRFWTVVLARAIAASPAFQSTALRRALAARTGPPTFLSRGKHRVYAIEGAYASWADAYTEADRVAHAVPGAYAVEVRIPASPPRRGVPRLGAPLPI